MIGHTLRILVLADSRAFHTERYVRELRRQGCCVLLASLERGPIVHARLKPIGPISAFHYFLAARQVRKLVARFKPDIVNPHFATGYGWLAYRAGCRKFAPVVLHLWGSDILLVPDKSPLHRHKARKALAGADAVIADSQYLLDRAAQIHPLNRSTVKYWGLERKYLAIGDVRRPLSKPVRVIVPRHHESIYNNAFILEALAPFLRARTITLTVPSFGSLFPQFKQAVEALAPGSVRYYERLPRDQFMMMLSQHDVYLSASRSDSSPASLIEATGLGLVPVVADIPGVREWMADGTGRLFEPESAASLQGAIAEILKSTDQFVALRSRNQDRVKHQAMLENGIADTIDLMYKLVQARA